MEIQLAKQKAESLINQHCPEYEFKFANGVCRFGTCYYRRKRITLSKRLVALNSEKEVIDTILHEIAHALTPGHHHDRVWKAKCIELGCRPIRCYTSANVVQPESKYTLICERCGTETKKYRRPKRYDYACKHCCHKYNNGRYTIDYLLTIKERTNAN